MKKPSVRIQLKGKKLGDPSEEFNDIVNTDHLKDDELFRECRNLALKVYHKEVVKPLAEKGRKFDNSCKKPRIDALRKLMIEQTQAMKKDLSRLPTARELWNKIVNNRIIQDVDHDDMILYWGRDKETKFKTFQERYTKIRKKNEIK